MQATECSRVTDYLLKDHKQLSALLAAATRGPSFDAEAFASLRAGLLRHIGIEEKLLLPAVRRVRGGEPIERARELRIEHAALTSLLVPTPDAALCGELAALLKSHDAKEEGPQGVYAECEQLLGAATSAALAQRAAEFPQVPVVAHFDGHGTYRTAALALAAASRMKQSSATQSKGRGSCS